MFYFDREIIIPTLHFIKIERVSALKYDTLQFPKVSEPFLVQFDVQKQRKTVVLDRTRTLTFRSCQSGEVTL